MKNEVVILLHGLGRSRLSMMLLGRRLERAGFTVLNFGYLALFSGIVEHAKKLQQFIEKNSATLNGRPFHLVGHSLGGLVARYYAGHSASPQLRRIVMLAPPNQPPRLAQFLRNFFLYRWLTGKSGQQLADVDFYANNFPVCKHEIGVIAGYRSAGTPNAKVYHQQNDLILNLDETRLPEMKSWQAIKSGHTFIMNRRDSFNLIERFLRSGTF